jgi:hypothetical protein
VANLNAAELSLTNLSGTQLLFEHDQSKKIGHCLASWEGRNGELRVAGVVNDPTLEMQVRRGTNHGLSLGTDVIQTVDGTALYKSQQELSICHEPRRPRCYVDTIDGKNVRKTHKFSTGALAN